MTEEQLRDDLKKAQRERDEVKVSTLRLLLSEIHNYQIQKGELSEQDLVSVVQREAKKRKEAAEAFRSGGREEQAVKEEAELKVLEGYLPEQISDEELTKIVEESITKVGASTPADMGKVIGMVMSQVGGRTDGGTVSNLVREKLVSK